MIYTVKSGDVLSKIAAAHKTTVEALLKLNPDIKDKDSISIGQKIRVKQDVKKYTVVSGDILSVIGKKLGVSWTLISEHNNIKPPYKIFPGDVLEIPGLVEEEKPSFDRTIFNDADKYGWIVKFYERLGWRVSSDYGLRTHPISKQPGTFHRGLDFAGKPLNAPINTPISGIVTISTFSTSWGNLVGVTDSKGFIHLFAHLNSRSVKVGDKVNAGGVIGLNGSTGESTGAHLHYQINTPGGGTIGINAHTDPKMFDYSFVGGK